MKKNVHEFEIKLDSKWVECLDKAFKKKVQEVKVDGFRKGACPKDVYIKKFGIESLYMDAADDAINIGYKEILDENKDLVPCIQPKVDVTGISDSNIIIKYTITEKPEVKLGEYKKLGVKKEVAKVTKNEIEEEETKLQNQMADLVIKDGKIEDGDTAVIDFVGFVDGEKLDGGTAENFSLEIGSHSFIPGFEEGLVGHKTNDKVTLNLKFPENYVEHLKGKDVKFDVTIHEVKTRVLPKMDEEFFKDLGYNDVKTKEELDKKVEEYLLSEKNKKIDDEHLDKVLDKAVENMKVELSEDIIDEEVHRMIDEYSRQLKMQGMSIEQYYEMTGTNHEALHKQMEGEATKRIKYRYLIEEVAKKENIEFNDKEVKAESKKMAENYGISEEELLKAYGSLDVVKYDMTMHKALEIIKENN